MKEIKLSPELEILIRAIRFVIGESISHGSNIGFSPVRSSNQELREGDGCTAKVEPETDVTSLPNFDTGRLMRLAANYEFLTDDSPLPNFDAGRLMRLAAMHKIRPILAEFDKTFNILDVQSRAQLDAIRVRQIQRNLKMVHELHKIMDKLESVGVDVVPMKGNLFIHVLYGNQQLRETGDIDILVPRGQVKDAVWSLEELGYKLNVGYKIVPEEHRDGLLDMIINSAHQSEIKLDDGRFHIDLHWKLAQPYYGLQCDEEGIFQRAETKTIYNQKLKVPCTTDIFWMMLVHHGGKEHWKSLRHLVDFHFMMEKMESEGIDVPFSEIRQKAIEIESEKAPTPAMKSTMPDILRTAGQIGVATTFCDGMWLYGHFLTLHVNDSDQDLPHLRALLKIWEGTIKGDARSMVHFNYYIRIPRGDQKVSIPTLFWLDMQNRIMGNKIRSYPQKFGILQTIGKALYLVVKIITKKS